MCIHCLIDKEAVSQGVYQRKDLVELKSNSGAQKSLVANQIF